MRKSIVVFSLICRTYILFLYFCRDFVSLMDFSQINGIQADSTAVQVAPASSVVMSRQTLDFGGVDAFRVDSSRLAPQKPVVPIVKTVPYIPVDDTISHPAYDVLTGDFVISRDGSITSQLGINAIEPISDSARAAQIITVETPKQKIEKKDEQQYILVQHSTSVLVEADSRPETNVVEENVDTVLVVADTVAVSPDTVALAIADTTADSVTIAPAPKVFVEKEGKPVAHRKFDGISLNKSIADTDWMIGMVIASCVIFAWTRMIYGKYIHILMQSAVNFFTARRAYEESNAVLGRVFFILNILFFINIGMFTTQCVNLYGISTGDVSGFMQFVMFTAAFMAFYLAKTIVLKILNFIFDTTAFGAYNFNIYLYNKVYGLLLLPLIAVIPFVPDSLSEKLMWIGLGLFVLFYVITLFRGLRICLKNRVSIFYLFFYLCALEILPLLTIYKCLINYAW